MLAYSTQIYHPGMFPHFTASVTVSAIRGKGMWGGANMGEGGGGEESQCCGTPSVGEMA